jgi:hypothetical protein
MGRRGALPELNTLIIGAIALIALLIFVGTQLVPFLSGQGKIAKCQATILRADLTEETTFGLLNTGSKCNDLPDLVIKKSNIKSTEEATNVAVRKKIADAMVNCWSMVGRGKLDPYKKFDGDNSYCMICADVLFEKGFVEEMDKRGYEIRDLNRWLATNTIPDLKKTYFEELYGVKPDQTIINGLENREEPIDYNKKYVVAWRMDAIKQSTAGALTRLGTGFVGGGVFGAKAAGALGTAIAGPLGTFIGGATGFLIGGTVGFVGTYWVSEKVFEQKGLDDLQLGNTLSIIPKEQLGNELRIEVGDEVIQKPFCTKLVNS